MSYAKSRPTHPLPKNKFNVILADPPWTFKVYSEKGKKRSAEAHYPVIKTREIEGLGVSRLAAPDSVLLLWTTFPNLPEAMEVIKAWGFEYKTVAFVWIKQNRRTPSLFPDLSDLFMGMGYWTRANCEFCLLATRGAPRRVGKGVRQAVFAPVRQHSRKPDEIYDRIESLLGGPYLELFARTKRRGWTAWGNETEKFPEPSTTNQALRDKRTGHKDRKASVTSGCLRQDRTSGNKRGRD